MRHSNSGRKLSRTPSHRKALFRNMAKALLTHGKIRTTEIKAKELRKVVEPLITLALRNDLHARRQAYRVLGNHQLVKKLFDEIGPLFVGIAGGYTRIYKLDTPRRGDNAPMAIIELTRRADAEETPAPVEEVKPKSAPAKKAAPKAEAKEAEKPKPAPAKKAAAKEDAEVAEKPKRAPAKKAAPKADAEATEKPKRAPAKKAAPKADEEGAEKPKRAPRKKAEPKAE